MRPVCEDLLDSLINAHRDEVEVDRFKEVSLAEGGTWGNEGTVFQCRFVVVKIGYSLFEGIGLAENIFWFGNQARKSSEIDR